MPKLPEGKQYGFIFNIAVGRQLDVYGNIEGLPRRKWWIIKEPDFLYKPRLAKHAIDKLERGV